MRLLTFLFFLIYVCSLTSQTAFGDLLDDYNESLNDELRTITTAVPFLSITPDSRAGAMGESGVATSPDLYSIFWNASKLAFIEDNSGFSISYTPWLSQLVPDISLAYLTGYSKINETSAWSASMRYFSLGNIQFTNDAGENVGEYDPNEYVFDLGYSMKLSDYFSAGFYRTFLNIGRLGHLSYAGETILSDLW